MLSLRLDFKGAISDGAGQGPVVGVGLPPVDAGAWCSASPGGCAIAPGGLQPVCPGDRAAVSKAAMPRTLCV
ncbi:hypothetical protein GUJ93_ZPchr0001g32531 [Zizania palustris]|uniref:Uncharacterized protein n=1 Tax=Zizania palustris TaxID=103762 RepID=A0A8J5RSP0_ZIZPA|nr:hypothetical protein GUJ93_ZPchr0001g32531 [Zizania palustris]